MSEERFSLYRLCECPECEGRGQWYSPRPDSRGYYKQRCAECRGEGRIRQEIATAQTPEAVGIAIVTLGREREWEGCAFGLLDRTPECETCDGTGRDAVWNTTAQTHIGRTCPDCKGSGVKPTGDWLVLPWLPSPRNVRDAARTLARSKKTDRAQ